ncbi:MULTISPECIES: hypothetical protein [unclassified Cryobacterium]|uniref:hypothetical protein n=1 Tax=unclassified Cryobacterium TaxID=2649013 RepID=UPI001F542DAA|nr:MULTISPECIES: hypothetical protein [unclassified Cryobacterium]
MSKQKKPSQGITAAELMAQLAGDQEYQRKKELFDAELQERVSALRRLSLPS